MDLGDHRGFGGCLVLYDASCNLVPLRFAVAQGLRTRRRELFNVDEDGEEHRNDAMLVSVPVFIST